MLIALIPLTRLIVGTTLGSTAAVVPITIGAFPFFARLVESALDEVEKGRIEAILSMGGDIRHVIFKVLLPQGVAARGATDVARWRHPDPGDADRFFLHGRGDWWWRPGRPAIRYGYQRFNNEVMIVTVVILVILVQGVQSLGDRLVRSMAHRR